MNTKEGPFNGMLVVEFASVLAGPSVGQFFAEMGATVLKIENIKSRGDVTRKWKLPSEPTQESVSAYFASANWGKQSLCVELSSEAIRPLIYKLVEKADVVLSSFKAGDAEKLKMDFNSLSVINPRLLYGHITGYGPEVARAGYDAVLQAEAGFMYLNGEAGGAPVKMPVALIDLMAAHQLKEGLLAGLYLREKTGKGQYVEVSLLKAAVASLANQATNYLFAGVAPERMGSEHPNIVPYGTVFKTSDQKELVLAIGDDRQFATLCAVLGEPALAKAQEFSTNGERVKHRKSLVPKLATLVQQFTRNELLQALIQKNVPAGAVHTIPEALAQSLVQPQLLLNEEGKPKGVRQIAFSAQGEESRKLAPPPRVGQHSRVVLEEWAGASKQEIEELARQKLLLLDGGENL